MPLPKKLAIARLAAVKRWPYYASALFALIPREKSEVKTMAVDMFWRLYFSPAFVEEHTVEHLTGVLFHEVEHLLRKHHGRRLTRNPKAWNVATDLEINDDLARCKVELPWGVLMPDMFNVPAGQMAEAYYDSLFNEEFMKWVATLEGIPFAGWGSDGSASSGEQAPWEDGEPNGKGEKSGIKESEGDLIRRRVAQAVREAMKTRGDIPAHLQRWAKELLEPKVDWRAELRAAVRGAMVHVSGMSDYTYRRPSRRSSSFPRVIMPSLVAYVPRVAIVVDTSGSMGEEELSQGLAEVKGVMDCLGRSQGVDVLSCDADIHTCRRIFRADQVELVGGGGTDMGRGIEAASQLRPRPDVIIVFTDGETPWPQNAPPGSKVIVAITTDHGSCPSWAKRIKVPCHKEEASLVTAAVNN